MTFQGKILEGAGCRFPGRGPVTFSASNTCSRGPEAPGSRGELEQGGGKETKESSPGPLFSSDGIPSFKTCNGWHRSASVSEIDVDRSGRACRLRAWEPAALPPCPLQHLPSPPFASPHGSKPRGRDANVVPTNPTSDPGEMLEAWEVPGAPADAKMGGWLNKGAWERPTVVPNLFKAGSLWEVVAMATRQRVVARVKGWETEWPQRPQGSRQAHVGNGISALKGHPPPLQDSGCPQVPASCSPPPPTRSASERKGNKR